MIRIGIVDDHTMFRQSLTRVIEAEDGFEIVAAVGSASEARARLPAAAPDVAVVDIGLPDLDGLSLAVHLREELESLRIVFLTMHDDLPTLRRAVGMGIQGYLLKSAPVAEFLSAVRAVAGGGSYMSPELTGVVMALAGGRSTAPTRDLTARETEVLRHLAAGQRPDVIASELFVAPKTVKNHLSSIYGKLGVESAAQAVAEAYRLRIARVGQDDIAPPGA